MKARIAVVTVSGRAYYLLVNELKSRNISFLSLTPNDRIPMSIKAIITTPRERSDLAHENMLEYKNGEDPAKVVDETIRVLKGKKSYKKLEIGVDPGQTFGLAILGDGSILESKCCTSVGETIDTIKTVLDQTPASHTVIKIGDGMATYTDVLWRELNRTLPGNVDIQSVGEEGTSRVLGKSLHRRGEKDVNSALRIALREGRQLPRKRESCNRKRKY